jgi:uncharacterized protein (UPF0548 family)
VSRQLFASVDEADALDSLRGRRINYDPATAPLDGKAAGHWHVDCAETVIGAEPPGPPVPRGAWQVAVDLVRRYEFAEPRIVRAVYREGGSLLGRDMLLEGRFFGLRFYLGVRVTGVIDETRSEGDAGEQVWGWSYQTLDGHLEQGRLTYEVIKNLGTGAVSFRVSGYSRRAPIHSPLVRLGFTFFGRWTQERFYRDIQQRLRELTQAALRGEPVPVPAVRPGGLVMAPSGWAAHPLDRLAQAWLHPGK